jgi:23S rRNA (cytidine1920-2'-O)/16S rRNA (cytidine1409-2'-O)-methyltransferase
VIHELPRFVSRGGEKLAAALAGFEITPKGWICADVGASTGGFTDCLLQAGAEKVYAIDVGKGQLHWRLRNDPRVVVMEATNARYLQELPDSVDLVVMDVSFISLGKVLPMAKRWLKREGKIIALIKPQFEAGKGKVGKGGVVRDPETHRDVLHKVFNEAEALGLFSRALLRSPLLGPKGNVEFLAELVQHETGLSTSTVVQNVLQSNPPQADN